MKTKTYGLFMAKTKLAELAKRANLGEEIIITNRGIPYAKLISAETKSIDKEDLYSEIVKVREKTILNPKGKNIIKIKELIEKGRK